MPAYVTMINSWGANWGDGGFIRISSENYYKFLMTPFCKEYDFNGNMVDPENMEKTEKMIEPVNVDYHGMQFTYFKVADDKPFVTYKTDPALLRSTLDTRVSNPLGGKSKKRKTKKRKTKKRKTKKRKTIKRRL